jgi:hypothetical protein
MMATSVLFEYPTLRVYCRQNDSDFAPRKKMFYILVGRLDRKLGRLMIALSASTEQKT